jgi:UPF0755 protein
VTAVLVAAAGSAWIGRALYTPWAGWGGPAIEVVLEPGLPAGTMVRRLEEAGVIRSAGLAKAWLWYTGDASRLHAGEYRFERPASLPEVLDRLVRGDVLLHPVTVPEGWTLDRVAERFATAGFGTREALLTAFADPTAIRDWDAEAVDLEGYLFPETYHFPRGTAPGAIAASMVARFREVVGASFPDRARAAGLDVRDAVTLASLIEAETSLPEERPRVSRVFHNRLERGMRLECDPTVQYALARAGRPTERLTYRDLTFDSPWNTYRVAGLPRGPICSPSWPSLEAAVSPAPGSDLYFVAAPGGGHVFSRDLASHVRAVAAWRVYSRSSR